MKMILQKKILNNVEFFVHNITVQVEFDRSKYKQPINHFC